MFPYLLRPARYSEENGSITVFEEGALPHAVSRAFIVSAETGQIRGEHAHKQCWQTLFAICGVVTVNTIARDGTQNFVLEPYGQGLVIPPMVWATQHYGGTNPQLLVVCSHVFDERDYIRSKDEFVMALSSDD